MDVTTHELFHVLGFQARNLNYFHLDTYVYDPNYKGDKYKTNTVVNITYRNRNTMVLKTANVLSETRRHFNCPSAIGMQLEN